MTIKLFSSNNYAKGMELVNADKPAETKDKKLAREQAQTEQAEWRALKAYKKKKIVSVEPAYGSSRNADAWEFDGWVWINHRTANEQKEIHFLWKNVVVPGRWKVRVFVGGELVRRFFVEDCKDLLKRDYYRFMFSGYERITNSIKPKLKS